MATLITLWITECRLTVKSNVLHAVLFVGVPKTNTTIMRTHLFRELPDILYHSI